MKERDEPRRCARVRESPGKALWPTGSFSFFDAGDALTCACDLASRPAHDKRSAHHEFIRS